MRKRKSFDRPEGVRSGRLVVIAAEGKKTENIYFEQMKASFHASGVQVEILRRDTNESSPEHVYRQIQDFVAEYDIDEDDQLWVVVDRDKWEQKMLSEVARKCEQNRYLNFCLSNPCFELWLILHLEDVAQYSEDDKKSLSENKKVNSNGDTWTKKRLRSLMGGSYHEAKYEAAGLLPKIKDAIARASKLDLNPKDRWPQEVGTRVYRLVNSILGKENNMVESTQVQN